LVSGRGQERPHSRDALRSGKDVVYVTYFDEVKAVNNQTIYWVGGVSVAMDQIQSVEAEVTDLAQELFGSIELTPETEFHANFIYGGKGPFKGMSVKKRIEVLVRRPIFFLGMKW
jgi:hypothetical protein